MEIQFEEIAISSTSLILGKTGVVQRKCEQEVAQGKTEYSQYI